MGKINYTLLNASVLNASRLNMAGETGKPGGGAGGYWPDGTPAAIRRSAVLWYDIAKQGATNETMAENPVLKDLSGHGHDATCYNFGWGGMSGVGGYKWIFADFRFKNFPYSENTITLMHSDKTTFETALVKAFIIQNNGLPGTSVKVTGMQPGDSIQLYNQISSSGGEGYPPIAKIVTIVEDGIYSVEDNVLPESYIDELLVGYIGFREIRITEGHEVIVEQLPKYPNALVSDGVDDYAYVDGLPILTPDRGYTIIAKRERIVDDAERLVTALFSKGRNCNVGNDTGVAVEISRMDTNRCISFDFPTNVEFSAQNIIYQTSTKYNDTELAKGESDDHSDILVLNKVSQSASNSLPAALYSLLLFDRDLTSEEIEWVKANIMDEAEPEPTPELDASLVDAWVFSGYRNEAHRRA